jgi:hypothetical protein
LTKLVYVANIDLLLQQLDILRFLVALRLQQLLLGIGHEDVTFLAEEVVVSNNDLREDRKQIVQFLKNTPVDPQRQPILRVAAQKSECLKVDHVVGQFLHLDLGIVTVHFNLR